jgi:hypothetical protein
MPPYQSQMLDMRVMSNAEETRAFYSRAIEPTAMAIAEELSALPRRGSDGDMDRWESLRTIQMETHRSFALSLGGLWERAIRENLLHAGYVLAKPVKSKLLSNIQSNGWIGIETAFKRIRGFDLAWFPMHHELLLLNLLSSAIRHGDGPASKKLYDADSSFFLDDVVNTGYYAYFAFGGLEPWAVRKLDVPLERLKQFTEAVAGFWEMIQLLREASAPQ